MASTSQVIVRKTWGDCLRGMCLTLTDKCSKEGKAKAFHCDLPSALLLNAIALSYWICGAIQPSVGS